MLQLPSVKIETSISKVSPDDIDLTNCIQIGNYFLEKLEHMSDLSHSVSYKTRNTKDYKLYTLYIIDRNMIMKHYSKSLVRQWIENSILISNYEDINSSKYIKHVEKKDAVYLIENYNFEYNLD